MTTIFSGWHEQYDRMLRSHERLTKYARGQQDAHDDSPVQARDALIHFFQDSYHLKDWLRNDQGERAIGKQPARKAVPQHIKDKVEDYINCTPVLQICADIVNGSKHLKLRPGKLGKPKTGPKTGDVNTAVAGEGVTLRPATVGSGMNQRSAIYSWQIESDDIPYDASKKASEIVAAWETWLRQNGLLP